MQAHGDDTQGEGRRDVLEIGLLVLEEQRRAERQGRHDEDESHPDLAAGAHEPRPAGRHDEAGDDDGDDLEHPLAGPGGRGEEQGDDDRRRDHDRPGTRGGRRGVARGPSGAQCAPRGTGLVRSRKVGSHVVRVSGGCRLFLPLMARLLLLTDDLAPSASVLPALGLLGHQVRTLPAEASTVMDLPDVDVILVDARVELAQARSLCRVLRTAEVTAPVIAILTEGGLTAVNAEWPVEDILLDRAGPAEVEARLRLSMTRVVAPSEDDERIVAGDLVIDESAYSARLGSRLLDLTYKEFELLKHLAQHPGRVFTRAQLLQEVWGYDYYGGTRTVDVHVRRLRAKLGNEHEQLIGTIRNVGYRFVVVRDDADLDDTSGSVAAVDS